MDFPKYTEIIRCRKWIKLRFKYDAFGNRVVKELPMRGKKEIYVRDAQGNILALYEVRNDSLFTKEYYMYGSQRLGYLLDEQFAGKRCRGNKNCVIFPSPISMVSNTHTSFIMPWPKNTPSHSVSITSGGKRYELIDWLGNVRVVINDRKTAVNSGSITLSYLP